MGAAGKNWNLLDPDVLGWLLERKFSAPLLIEFTELRLAVEPGAAALAARVAGPEEKAAIRNAIERMQAADTATETRWSPISPFMLPCCTRAGTDFMRNSRDSPQPHCVSASA